MAKLDKQYRPHVWRDEDKDWVWLCRKCWVSGPVERSQPAAFENAWKHARGHAIIGFQ